MQCLSVPTPGGRAVESWLWKIAAERTGDVEIVRQDIAEKVLFFPDKTVTRRCRLRTHELTKLAGVAMLQYYTGAKSTVFAAQVAQRACAIWPDANSIEHFAMRMIAPSMVVSWLSHERDAKVRFCMYHAALAVFASSLGYACFHIIGWRLPVRDLRPFPVWQCSEDWLTFHMQTVRPYPLELSYQKLVAFWQKLCPNNWFVGHVTVGLILGSGAYLVYNHFNMTRCHMKRLEGVVTDTSTDVKEATMERDALGYRKPGDYVEESEAGRADVYSDAEYRAITSDGRTFDCGGWCGVLGQDPSPTAPLLPAGFVALPVSEAPNVYATTPGNVDVAVRERIVKKQQPFAMTEADKQSVASAVTGLLDNLFTKENVQAWADRHDLSALKSKKWSAKRFEATYEKISAKDKLQYRPTIGIKNEPMPHGKAPRMLIADGDDGQMMSVLADACIEGIVKEKLPRMTIKGRHKRQALNEIFAHLRMRDDDPTDTITGDGTAWDTKCSSELRAITENVIVGKVIDYLAPMLRTAEQWDEALTEIMARETLDLPFEIKNSEDPIKVLKYIVIDAIRRSGDRGTSILNWLINYIMWMCAFFEAPRKLMGKPVVCAKDRWGVIRVVKLAFEGDDSLATTTPKLKTQQQADITSWWTRGGHQMKLEFGEDHATFVGVRLEVDKSGPTGVFGPEVDRCMKRSGISCSPGAVLALKSEDVSTLATISAAAAWSRALDFAPILPSISRKYRDYAKSHGAPRPDAESTHDLRMRFGVEDEDVMSAVISRVESEMAAIEILDELDNLKRLGYPTSAVEYGKFLDHPWDFSQFRDYSTFAGTLPASWK